MRYEGFKEEIYLPAFVPDPDFRAFLGVADTTILVLCVPRVSQRTTIIRRAKRFFGSVSNFSAHQQEYFA